MSTRATSATIAQITVADEPERWETQGFTVSDATVQLGSVASHPRRQRRGAGNNRLVAPRYRRRRARRPVDHAVATRPSPTYDLAACQAHQRRHENRPPRGDVTRPESQRRGAASRGAGPAPDPRAANPAGAPRQAFFRLGEVILEVVQEPEEALAARPDGTNGPARFWGPGTAQRGPRANGRAARRTLSEIRPGPAGPTHRHAAAFGRMAVPIALMSRHKRTELAHARASPAGTNRSSHA